MEYKFFKTILNLSNKKLITLLNLILRLLKERDCPIRDNLELEFILEKVAINRELDEFVTSYQSDRIFYERKEEV